MTEEMDVFVGWVKIGGRVVHIMPLIDSDMTFRGDGCVCKLG